MSFLSKGILLFCEILLVTLGVKKNREYYAGKNIRAKKPKYQDSTECLLEKWPLRHVYSFNEDHILDIL